ncbi:MULTISPECIES: multiubiquitin domain-containing protein [unclassified Bradyrhizobium]|uniref:multiubiquitin domain-containing protein n=1 Tax=unclassified Bradyrhizobium TaxID=2631580 RepID=UPI002915E943|nr:MULTISPECIES: multiubiquitin domain-containing protein [unclassified Bradyrhizobium]
MTMDDPSSPPEHGNPAERALEHIHHAEQDLEKAHQQEQRAEHELADAEHELEEALHPRESEIVVNARKRTVKGDIVSFEEIVQIAFPGSHDPDVAFSMTYRHAASDPHAGELGPGGHVKVKKEGTIFNVTKTIRS